jgi:hypothetical protein
MRERRLSQRQAAAPHGAGDPTKAIASTSEQLTIGRDCAWRPKNLGLRSPPGPGSPTELPSLAVIRPGFVFQATQAQAPDCLLGNHAVGLCAASKGESPGDSNSPKSLIESVS